MTSGDRQSSMVGHDHQCLRQKGSADPLTTCSAREDPVRVIVILRRQLSPKHPQPLRTALNVAGVLEQTLTPFCGPRNGCSRFAPDSSNRPSNLDAIKIE